MGGLGSGPSLKMGGFQSCHSREKQGILELKIIKKCTFYLNEGLFDLPRTEKRNKELYIFEKGIVWSGPGRKSRVFSIGQGRKNGVGGGAGAFARTYPYCPYMVLPPPPGG